MAPVSPPPSPLQKMKNPFVTARTPPRRLNPVSLRTRTGIRATIIAFTVFILFYVVNEVRCLQGGCISRAEVLGKDSDKGPHVGGGAVIGKPIPGSTLTGDVPLSKSPGLGESVWGTHGVVGGWIFKPKKTNTTATAIGKAKEVPPNRDMAVTSEEVKLIDPPPPPAAVPAAVPQVEQAYPIGAAIAQSMAQEKEMYLDQGRIPQPQQDKAGLAIAALPATIILPPIPTPETNVMKGAVVALSPAAFPTAILKSATTQLIRAPLSSVPNFNPEKPLPTPRTSQAKAGDVSDVEQGPHNSAAEQHAMWEDGDGEDKADDVGLSGAMLGMMDMNGLGGAGGLK